LPYPALATYGKSPAGDFLRSILRDHYTVSNLKGVSAAEFQQHITALPGRRDTEMEGYVDPTRQRELSIQFEWGHNHDFGVFRLLGLMGDRHIDILATFMSLYGRLPENLADKVVLDVGCWTGGMSLLLAGMGAQVVAIEEVRKYAECVHYLKRAFGLENLEVHSRSLYSLDGPRFDNRFDIVVYSGVLYHVSDPVLSLRTVFNCLKDGGVCLLETAALDSPESTCLYGGRRASATRDASRPVTLLGGWDWFVPSLPAIQNMLTDVGFEICGSVLHEGGRATAVARRVAHVDMLRAGLSRPDTR
jgi:2-polyprenyl-3-methyl-5-hydroxy-6-metoxy-1,4-benzoquinol methylase